MKTKHTETIKKQKTERKKTNAKAKTSSTISQVYDFPVRFNILTCISVRSTVRQVLGTFINYAWHLSLEIMRKEAWTVVLRLNIRQGRSLVLYPCVFSMTRSGFEPTASCTQKEDSYQTDRKISRRSG